MNRRHKIIPIIMLFLITACTANLGNVPWYTGFPNWIPEKKANFLMKAWLAEKANYDALNAIENKSESLIKVLEIKREILEKSRVPVRGYVKIVKDKGIPPNDMEEAIVKWIREMQTQYMY